MKDDCTSKPGHVQVFDANSGLPKVLYRAGDRDYDFIAIESGQVDVQRPARPGSAEALIVRCGPGAAVPVDGIQHLHA
jgi:hypothetical protein